MDVWAYRRAQADMNYKTTINFVTHKSDVSHRACPLLVPTHASPAPLAPLFTLAFHRVCWLQPRFGTCAMEFDRRFTAIKDAGRLLKRQSDLSARPPIDGSIPTSDAQK
jgi:hypothetical protein